MIETLDEIAARLEEIRRVADDDEHAHLLQEKLYIGVLEAIAAGAWGDGAEELASLALKAQDIDFVRWYA